MKNNTVLSKNKTAVMANNLNTSSNMNSSNNGNINNGVQKTQVSSTVGKAGLESIMGQKLMGPKISTIKR